MPAALATLTTPATTLSMLAAVLAPWMFQVPEGSATMRIIVSFRGLV